MVSASTRWLPWTTMEPTAGVWACASGAVSDTTPALNKIPPRTRPATPSPRKSHLQIFIRTTPFVVPFGHPYEAGTHEKGRHDPQKGSTSSAACTGFFLLRNQVLPPP